jgi:hypothetical protein
MNRTRNASNLQTHLTKVAWNSFQGLKSYGPDPKCAWHGRK